MNYKTHLKFIGTGFVYSFTNEKEVCVEEHVYFGALPRDSSIV